MKQFTYITLKQQPQLKEQAAEWFHQKMGCAARSIFGVHE